MLQDEQPDDWRNVPLPLVNFIKRIVADIQAQSELNLDLQLKNNERIIKLQKQLDKQRQNNKKKFEEVTADLTAKAATDRKEMDIKLERVDRVFKRQDDVIENVKKEQRTAVKDMNQNVKKCSKDTADANTRLEDFMENIKTKMMELEENLVNYNKISIGKIEKRVTLDEHIEMGSIELSLEAESDASHELESDGENEENRRRVN